MLANVLLPICLIALLGYWAVRSGFIASGHIQPLSQFVMKVSLPAFLVQALASTRLGVTYHSQVVYHLSGDTSASGFLTDLVDGGPQRYDSKLNITTPSSVDFSVTHQLNDDWTLYAGSTYTRWSQLKKITPAPRNPIPVTT